MSKAALPAERSLAHELCRANALSGDNAKARAALAATLGSELA
jgi:hypothetical protein